MTTIEELIKGLLVQGVSVEMVLTEYDQVGYNVNTGAKSELVLVEDCEQNWLMCFKRYDKDSVVSLEDDLNTVVCNIAREVKSCMCGRDYVSEGWLSIMEEQGLVEIETVTQRTIKF